MRRSLGFTLIELSIVLLIIGLLLAGFLAPLAITAEQRERTATRAQLDALKDTLYGYALQHGHLPCPDCNDLHDAGCNDGEEDRVDLTGGNPICRTNQGNIPWVALGVKGSDAWNQPFTYAVTAAFADEAEDPHCPSAASFSLCSDGDIKIMDAAASADATARNIPAVIVSHGKNWSDTPSADEVENTDNDAVFVDKDYSQADGEAFDDLVIWISPHALKVMMVRAGALP